MRVKINMFMKNLIICAILAVAVPVSLARNNENSAKEVKPPVIILKLDDMTYQPANDNWQRCLDLLAKNKIKCAVGIIGFSLEKDRPDYFKWIKEQHESGMIEFWCHGYRNRKSSDKIGEFEESYESQKEALEKCQQLAKQKLGFPFKSFGPHWSGTNAGTVKAISEITEITTWMYGDPKDAGNSKKYIYPRYLGLEYKTFLPDVEKFKESYIKQVKEHDCFVLQGHPMAWGKDGRWENFVAIIEFLKSQNCEFMTPSEYYEQRVKLLP